MEQRIDIQTELDVARLVMVVGEHVRRSGYGESDRCKLATVASELARNIIKYAQHGTVILRDVETGHMTGLEIVAADRGPGIEDLAAAMSDHYSSSGTLGLGLPGVKRMVDEFEIDSTPGIGTRVTVRKWR